MTLAATGTTAKSSLVDALSMRSKSRSPSPIPPAASANKAITIQIDFPRGTPTPKVNFRSNKASIYEGSDHMDKPTTPGLAGLSPNTTGALWYLKRGDGASVTGGGFNTMGT